MGGYSDITGQKFGRLTAVERVPNYKYNGERGAAGESYKGAIWLCKCDCGGEKIVAAQNLKTGRTQSCGCLWREAMKGRKKKVKA